MGMESRKYERPGERAVLELHFGPDPPEVADLPSDVVVQASACPDDASASATGESADESSPDVSLDASLEDEFETDPALVPAGASALLVAPAVLDPQEVEALLSGLHSLLEETSAAADANALASAV